MLKSESGRDLHFRVTGSTHRSAFAFTLTSETRRTFSSRPRRHALSVTQTRQKPAVSQRTFKWLHRAELYSLSRCHEINSFVFHRGSLHSRFAFMRFSIQITRIYTRKAAGMSEEEDTVVKTRHAFEDLCRALNMDEESSNGAWRSYENISKNYTLEVK